MDPGVQPEFTGPARWASRATLTAPPFPPHGRKRISLPLDVADRPGGQGVNSLGCAMPVIRWPWPAVRTRRLADGTGLFRHRRQGHQGRTPWWKLVRPGR